jgi:hypothetical protein
MSAPGHQQPAIIITSERLLLLLAVIQRWHDLTTEYGHK